LGATLNLLNRLNYWFMPSELRSFKRKVAINFKVGKYTVRTAETADDVYWALRLRYRVFFKKYLGRALPLGLDTTPYDLDADHLLVCDPDGIIVGTYRLRSSTFTKRFYSMSEFHLLNFQHTLAGKLELSRACIDPDKRQGVVIMCLWRGILKYASEVQATQLFGCVSVMTSDVSEAASILRHLQKQDYHRDAYCVVPRSGFTMPSFQNEYAKASQGVIALPPLFSSYLKIGARVYGEPAYDSSFKCMDYFTVLDLKDMDKAYADKLAV